MADRRKDGLYFVILGCLVLVALGSILGLAMDWSMADFKQLYYGARCLHEHSDPYDKEAVLATYRKAGIDRLDDLTVANVMAIRNIYPPSQFLFTFPFGWLDFSAARLLWIALTLVSLIVGAILTWKMGADYAPLVSGVLIGFMLLNSETLVALGNAAGIAIGLCVIAAWCFLNRRHVAIGVICLALSLLLKPQDAALIPLFFLLGDRIQRKGAIQSLILAFVSSLAVALCITSMFPRWLKELAANLSYFSAPGGLSDPGPSSMKWRAAMVNLQTVISLFDNNPSHYNLVTYILCSALLLPLAVVTFRTKPSRSKMLIGLAAIVAITLLITYHRRNDTKLLLLSVPACALLWAEGDKERHLALAVTSAAFFFTGDFFWIASFELFALLRKHHSILADSLQVPFQVLPVPLSLLAMAMVYVWVYIRRPTTHAEAAISS